MYKENGGLASACNSGINIYTGDRIIFIDGDYWIPPIMIETMACKVTQNNSGMVIVGNLNDCINDKDEIIKETANISPYYTC
ncbi:glycosyltransferase [Bifidobacterium dolichotidis]|uniref:glycosyltransferase n=1 Tax=Bifidobacterium dolichotidis TaxID=2306976 RepID=UPI003B96E189